MERHFASICGSSLWNPATVYSSHPDLTFCFQYTLLTWIPCFFVWLSSPLWIFMLTKPTVHKIKASWLLFFKTAVTLGLILIEVVNLARAFKEQTLVVYFMTPVILISTYVFVLLITHYERFNGWRNSTIVFLFWFTLFVASTVTLRSKLIYETNRENTKYLRSLKRQYQPDDHYLGLLKLTEIDLFTFYIFYFLVGFNTLLSVFSEDVDHKSKSAEITASLISKLTFWWTDKLIRTGFKKELKREDLFEIDEREKVEHNTQKLEKMWTPRAQSYILKIREIENRVDPSYVKEVDQEKINLNPRKDESQINEEIKKVPQPSLAWCLIQIHVYKFIGLLSIKLAHDLLNLARPILLDKLISFVMDKEQSLTVGLFYIGLLCVSSLTQTLIMQHYYHTMFLMGNRIKNSVMQLIFNKSLRLSTSARKSTTVGEMTNVLTTNTHSFDFCMFHFVSCVSVPIQLAMSIYMLWIYIGGAATIAGLASMLLFLPLNGIFGRFSKKMRREGYKLTDARIKVLNELLNGIRVVKFYGWEKSFQEIIKKLRNNELLLSIKLSLISTLMSLTWSCAPIAITVISFGTYLSLNEKNNLDPNTAFVSLTLFSMLRFPLNMLPHLINAFIQLNVSITRIRELLLKDELKGEDISHEPTAEYALTIDNISFGWSKNEAALKDISLRVKKGQLVAIIGKVGSGKSSLMSAIIGEMHKLNNNTLNIDGKTSYVAQQAWIKNDTVKNNIVFNAEIGFDETFYNKVIRNCQLVPDLEIMPASDETEIGEKGINLSGGQKQRISLARSVYANSDIYLLDDPLSAVDAHVGKNLFDLVLGPKGMLKDKTRVLVTNSLNILEQVDMIVMLDNGCIVEQGTYGELKKNENNAFNEFVRTYFEKKEQLKSDLAENSAAGQDNEETGNNVKRSVSRSYSKQKSHISVKEKDGGDNEPLLASGKNESAGKIVQKEKIESGSVKWSVIWAYIKACRWYVSIVFVLLYIMSSVSDMGSNYWLSSWSDQVTADRETANRRKFYYLTIYASLGVSKSFINFLGNICFVGMYVKATRFFHDKLLYSVLRGQLRFFESTPSGRIVNRFTKDIEATEDSIPYSIKSIIECLLGLTSTVIIICSSTPYFAIALVPITIVYILVQRYYVPTNRQLKRLQKASKSPIFSHFSETQAGISTIRAFNGQKWVKKIMEKSINEHFVYYYCNAVSNRWLALRLEILGNVITILAAVFAIFAKNNLTAGLAGLSISISLTISSNLNWLVRTLSEFEANITSMERIIEYFDIKHEPEWHIEETKPSKEWPQSGNVVLRDYSLKYRQELENVLSDLNININPGEKIGIVGRTGAGKSSLTLALFRLLEHTKGDIVIDNININKIGLHDLRHKLTIIPQDPVIFSGTIRMNLDPFKMHTDEEVWRSLELSHLKEFVSSQDKKLEFECSEGGENLSVGQRQLICLARALLRKTKILILDEATASIDYNTDELIQETIRSQFSECTVLTIAHRLNTIMDSSRILVLDKGKVAEFDTPQSLLAQKNGIFYSMAKNAGLV